MAHESQRSVQYIWQAACAVVCLMSMVTFSPAEDSSPAANKKKTEAKSNQVSEPDAADDAERKQRLEHMKRQAAVYDVTLDTAQPSKLTLHEDALLRFSNPVSGVPDGILVMWQDGARPAIFAQVFQTKDGLWVHECQSLAAAGLTMRRGETIPWRVDRGTNTFRPLPDAPPPSDSAAKRLVQMRQIATGFSGTDDFKINATDKEAVSHTLRMLPTPIYRYQDPDQGIADGSVFAFVHGTDPEVLLVIEQRTTKDAAGKELAGWFYSLTAMTCWGVNISRKGTEVWSSPERLGTAKNGDAYFVWVYDESR